MDLGPEEKFLRFSELSENRAQKTFAHFCVQPAAPGLILKVPTKMCFLSCHQVMKNFSTLNIVSPRKQKRYINGFKICIFL